MLRLAHQTMDTLLLTDTIGILRSTEHARSARLEARCFEMSSDRDRLDFALDWDMP